MAKIPAREMIDEVMDFSPRFRSTDLPEATLLRYLSRRLNVLLSDVSIEAPDIVSVAGAVTKDQIDEALDDADNDTNSIDVPPFNRILKNVRIRGTSQNPNVEFPVNVVSLAEQYPVSYEGNIDFPSISIRDSAFLITDIRKFVGGEEHGWEEYNGPLTYHYVPYYLPLKGLDESFDMPHGLRGALALATAAEVAKRQEMWDMAANLIGRYPQEIQSFVNQTIQMRYNVGFGVVQAD